MKLPLTSLRAAIVLLWSTLVWTALWFEVSVANVLWGVVVGALTLLVVPLPRPANRVGFRPVAGLRLALFFVSALVRASAIVAWEIVTPGSRINEGIVVVPLRVRCPGVVTLVANMISLTPGTLTIAVREGEPTTLYVHVLHLDSPDQTRADVRHLEDLTMRAFPSEPQTEETR